MNQDQKELHQDIIEGEAHVKTYSSMNQDQKELHQDIIEGEAHIKTAGNVFYNPVQEFNRDLSIAVLGIFAQQYIIERRNKKSKKMKESLESTTVLNDLELPNPGIVFENGISILEGLSATGLRSIRYAKEIPGIKQITANDLSFKAVEDIKRNVEVNNVQAMVIPTHSDATMLMYQHRRENQFDAIDLDPYGCPSIFLDSAVQAVNSGGLLLVTATDMAVLAGNAPETCYSKYGSISLRIKSCHEMAIRILLQCIESHANRYARYIVPLLSVSADFYIRVFVRVFDGAHKCKFTISKLSSVYHCTGCDSFCLQPLGILKNVKNGNIGFGLPLVPAVSKECEHCGGHYHVGGPIWSAPIHSEDFIKTLLCNVSEKLKTYRRIVGVLTVISEELLDIPLYYTLEKLCGTIHVETPPMLQIRSAILNAGYRVSFTHMHKNAIKTNAPSRVMWDIMRSWTTTHPVNDKRLKENTPAAHILGIKPEKEYSFQFHPLANPESRKLGLTRFQENPTSHWGPGTRATAMVGDQKISKSRRNQGKRKREESPNVDERIDT